MGGPGALRQGVPGGVSLVHVPQESGHGRGAPQVPKWPLAGVLSFALRPHSSPRLRLGCVPLLECPHPMPESFPAQPHPCPLCSLRVCASHFHETPSCPSESLKDQVPACPCSLTVHRLHLPCHCGPLFLPPSFPSLVIQCGAQSLLYSMMGSFSECTAPGSPIECLPTFPVAAG